MRSPSYAAVDWGTSTFRLWLMDSDGGAVAERRSDEGMMRAGALGFAAVLEAHLAAAGAAADLPVVICGMAGSRQGWHEARYLDLPASLDAIVHGAVAVPHEGRRVMILPGLAQRLEACADVMRGEETQLLGAAGGLPAAESDGFYCMPGTHSKWVRLAGGVASGFSTFMTGEIFALMAEQSILKHAVAGEAVATEDHAFADAVRQTFEAPALLTSRLFSIRGSQLLFSETPAVAKARLSGFLIGAEIAGSGAVGRDRSIRLIASGKLRTVYEAAFAALDLDWTTIDADACVRDGLAYAARHLFSDHEGQCRP